MITSSSLGVRSASSRHFDFPVPALIKVRKGENGEGVNGATELRWEMSSGAARFCDSRGEQEREAEDQVSTRR